MSNVIYMADHRPGFVRAQGFDCTEEEAPAFVRGFEAGMLAARLDGFSPGERPAQWAGTYHAENVENLRRTAEACGYDVNIGPTPDPNWVYADFTRRSS